MALSGLLLLGLGAIAGRRGAEYVGAEKLEVHEPSLWNAVISPLRNGALRHITQIGNGVCSAKRINDFIRVHA